jgi:hypothetical protein
MDTSSAKPSSTPLPSPSGDALKDALMKDALMKDAIMKDAIMHAAQQQCIRWANGQQWDLIKFYAEEQGPEVLLGFYDYTHNNKTWANFSPQLCGTLEEH